jgi:photosystem II stability/assembly factor-like uncharacterized protein
MSLFVMNRRFLVLATAALVCGCGGAGSRASDASGDASTSAGGDSSAAASTDGTTSPNDGASGDAIEESNVADAGGASDSSGGGSPETSTQVPPPVDAGDCPNLPALLDGGWMNVSPPGSNYSKTYSGINAVALRPDNPAVVYAGADSNGMFRSTDCGATWSLVNTGQNAAALSSGRPWSLVIDPISPEVIYTVEGYGASGLWKSTNAGVDWVNVLTPEISNAFYAGGQITGISIDPRDHTHLVIESHGNGSSNCGVDGGAVGTCLAESSDGGMTWTLKVIPQPWAENSSVLIVNRKTWLWGGFFGGLWQTSDEGATWTEVLVNGKTSSPGLPNAYAETNYYEPYSWQDSSGRYYLPSKSWFLPGGVIRSAPNDTSQWTAIPGSPQGQFLYPTSTQLVVSSEGDPHYYIAPQSDPTQWSPLPGPDAGLNSQNGLGVYDAYDAVHHILYSSCFNSGLWERYVP